MSASTVLLLLLLVAPPVVHAAPLTTAVTQAQILVQAESLVQRILQSLVTIQAQTQTGLTSDLSHLELMRSQLQIPPTPVLQPLAPPTYTQENLLGALLSGLEQQQRIVAELSSKLSALSNLGNDLRDLREQVTALMSSMGVATSAAQHQSESVLSNIDSEYKAQVAAALTLTTLREFCQDARRALRSLRSLQTQR